MIFVVFIIFLILFIGGVIVIFEKIGVFDGLIYYVINKFCN